MSLTLIRAEVSHGFYLTHLLGGAGIRTLSVRLTADGGCQPVMVMVPYFTKKTGSVLFIRAAIPQTRITTHDTIYYNCIIHRHPCATRPRYTLLRYSSNFEENDHKQVTGYREASTSLLSPYLFSFRRFFRLCITMHRMVIQFNSISPVSNLPGV